MPGVGIQQAARVSVDPRVAERRETARRHVAAQQAVDAGANRGGRGGVLREGADGGLEVRHQKRCRQPLPGDVGNRYADRAAEANRVEAVAANAVCWLPAHGDADPRHVWKGGRQQAALNQARFLEVALLFAIAAPLRACFGDLPVEDLEQGRFLPWLLHEAARAAPHRLDRGVDAPPPGHDDDGEVRRQRADLRDQVEAFAAGRRVAAVVQVHQEQVERVVAQALEHRVG